MELVIDGLMKITDVFLHKGKWKNFVLLEKCRELLTNVHTSSLSNNLAKIGNRSFCFNETTDGQPMENLLGENLLRSGGLRFLG
jgi:hypothetical protein